MAVAFGAVQLDTIDLNEFFSMYNATKAIVQVESMVFLSGTTMVIGSVSLDQIEDPEDLLDDIPVKYFINGKKLGARLENFLDQLNPKAKAYPHAVARLSLSVESDHYKKFEFLTDNKQKIYMDWFETSNGNNMYKFSEEFPE